jgi:hypothetical protein
MGRLFPSAYFLSETSERISIIFDAGDPSHTKTWAFFLVFRDVTSCSLEDRY